MTRPVLYTHRVTVALIGLFVLTATVDGFAQSWAGLYSWAVEHGLHGWKAEAFPGLVDLFILVGELGLFALALEAHKLTSGLAWLDLAVPGLAALAGWSVSLAFNVGHVHGPWQTQVTAAAAPVASMLGLLVLLRTLHRFVTRTADDEIPAIPDRETPGRDPLDSLIIAVCQARAAGVGAERIGKLFGGSRHYVDKLVVQHTTPVPPPPTSANGTAVPAGFP